MMDIIKTLFEGPYYFILAASVSLAGSFFYSMFSAYVIVEWRIRKTIQKIILKDLQHDTCEKIIDEISQQISMEYSHKNLINNNNLIRKNTLLIVNRMIMKQNRDSQDNELISKLKDLRNYVYKFDILNIQEYGIGQNLRSLENHLETENPEVRKNDFDLLCNNINELISNYRNNINSTKENKLWRVFGLLLTAISITVTIVTYAITT